MTAIETLRRKAAMSVYDFVDKDPAQNISKHIEKLVQLGDGHAIAGMAAHIGENFSAPARCRTSPAA